MATRNKEVCVLLLDVGPFTHPALAFAIQAASTFVLSKILNKPQHELAIVLYGTEGTSNPLQEEMAADGEPDQFTCITVLQPLSLPDQSLLISLSDAQKGSGRSDFVDALTVAVDCIYRAAQERPILEGAGIKKRVILISNFLQRAAGDADDPFLQAIADKMRDKDMLLEIVSVDVPEQDAQAAEDKAFNRQLLDVIMAEVRCKTRSVSRALDLAGALATREYAHTAYYSGPFTIGDMMTIKVKVCKKTSKEKLPTLNKYSDRSALPEATHQETSLSIASAAAKSCQRIDCLHMCQETHRPKPCMDSMGISALSQSLSLTPIIRNTEYRTLEGEEAVRPEDKVKAYKYGRQVVPISPEQEDVLQYFPEKGFELIGFVQGDSVPPRHYFMKDTWVVAPEKGNEGAQLAMSALAHAMTSSQQRAVLSSGDDKPHAMGDDVINPMIHRFHSFIANLVVDPSAQVPDSDPLLEYTLKGEVTSTEALNALKALPSAFPMKAGVAAEKGRRRKDVTQEMKADPEDGGPAHAAEGDRPAEADVKSEDAKEEDLGEVVAAKEQLATLRGSAEDFDDMD
ncbi:hypothetical protein WJX73_003919 [Symbiochloris irregularis]|uniref:Ku domain-containing protein n=1 Tax=Symbiochloris irregularis TaxID=706552 RepID=A0AAW1PLQ4_9CHLO